MPAENFVVCQRHFAYSLNPDKDQQKVCIDLDPNCLTPDDGPGWFICRNLILKKVNRRK